MDKNESVNAIPTSELMTWFNEELKASAMLRSRLNEMQGPPVDPKWNQTDIERVAGQVQGRRDLLLSFAALLIFTSADVAGELDALTEDLK